MWRDPGETGAEILDEVERRLPDDLDVTLFVLVPPGLVVVLAELGEKPEDGR